MFANVRPPFRKIVDWDVMLRQITVGTAVKIIGSIAEHYPAKTAVVLTEMAHPSGLAHLHQYRVFSTEFGEDTFYEFQLAPVFDQNGMELVHRADSHGFHR